MAVDLKTETGSRGRHRRARRGAGRAWPIWAVRRQVCAGDADAGARRAGIRLRRSSPRPQVPGRGRPSRARLCRPPDAPLLRAEPDRSRRRREDLPQAGGSRAHRRAQDQQRARSGTAGQTDGQATHHRRDRRRATRRGDGDRLRAARSRVHRLHGRGRHRAAIAERLPHEAARRRGAPGQLGLAHAQGRDQRGDPRLGHQCREHLLHLRHGRRHAPLPDDGARFAIGHRAGSARADARRDRRAAGRRRRLRRRRLERDRDLLSVHPGSARSSSSASRPPGTESRAGATPRRSAPARSACCTDRARTSCRTSTGRCSRRIRSRPVSITPASDPSTRTSRKPAARRYVAITDAEALEAFQTLCRTEGIIPALESSHTIAHALPLARRLGPDRTLLVNLSGRGDKDLQTAADALGMSL